ncbi:UNVERIFIED_CONTAM: hypothetical protein Sindi_1773000 [Sesamum indicum]
MVEKTNLDSLVKLQYHTNAEGRSVESVRGTLTLKRILVGLDALKHGFLQRCSPLLGFDGCHLKGPYRAVTLVVIGLDGNNGIVPYGTDRQKLILCYTFKFFRRIYARIWWSISELVPNAINRKCCRHISANLRQQFIGMMLKKYFWQAVRSYTVGDLRSKPILSWHDGLRVKIMSRLHKRFQKKCALQGEVVTNVLNKLNFVKELATQCNLLFAGEDELKS